MYDDKALDYIISYVHENVFFDHLIICFQINTFFEGSFQMD